MSDDTPVAPPKVLTPIKNRKQRRYEAKLARSKKVYRNPYHWHLRILGEMKENKRIEEKLVTGEFDYFLPVKFDEI